MNRFILFLLSLLLFAACTSSTKDQDDQTTVSVDSSLLNQPAYEAISLLGDTLYRVPLPAERQKQYDSLLMIASKNYQQDTMKLDNIIWLGRRLAYLSRYQEAIKVYSQGIEKYPESAELYRHRGHRYISVRQFDKAIADLEKAASLLKSLPLTPEANGIPVPLPVNNQASSLQFNTFYHLGLAHYLKGEYGKAVQAYEKCMNFCQTDDEIAATADWQYMAYRRLGEDEVAEETLAAIRQDMDIRENEGYFERLLMYKGLVEPDSLLKVGPNVPLADRDLALATQGYGVGNFYLYNGEAILGQQILEDIVEGRHWAAFGYIAAEADLARMKKP